MHQGDGFWKGRRPNTPDRSLAPLRMVHVAVGKVSPDAIDATRRA